ncbi:hypothetical protein STAS_28010 [Striga asiatica]|uniref:Neprosin PEP catalytic domain-containing protein n=1 Tax=Striga asiatica TaxID=4170 RepID=A0A5A7QZY7_STRAF|nr:hypothetical protein STAS_28010 [Striga asiatica]
MGAAQCSDGLLRGKMQVVFFLVFVWCLVSLSCAGRLSSSRQKLEVQKHLKRLNKPPVKTIKVRNGGGLNLIVSPCLSSVSPDGDIIDCVHISHQPALDHPFLKDHKIQARPSYHPEGLFDLNEMSAVHKERPNTITQLWHMNGRCPDNTVPIRRTKKEDVLRASSVKSYGKKKHKSSFLKPRSVEPDFTTQTGHQHAIAYVEGEKYYGAKATINVWEPKIQQPNEFSLSQIWILGGSFGQDLNSIEAGWQVSPDLYGDNNTRLFTYWTSDAYQATGCYNLLCSGFIQVNSDIAMGASESASMIEWGGEVVNSEPNGQHTSTQMGSGRFPEEGFGKSSYFRNIQVVDASNNLKSPKGLGTYTEQSNCYDIQTGYNGEWGSFFYYGGPGLNSNCQ